MRNIRAAPRERFRSSSPNPRNTVNIANVWPERRVIRPLRRLPVGFAINHNLTKPTPKSLLVRVVASIVNSQQVAPVHLPWVLGITVPDESDHTVCIVITNLNGGNCGSIRHDSGMQRLRLRVPFHCRRAGILSIPWVHQLSTAMPALPERPPRTAPRQLRWRRWRRRRRIRRSQGILPHRLQQLWRGRHGALPTPRRPAGLLQRLLLADAQLLTPEGVDGWPNQGQPQYCPSAAGRLRPADSVCRTKTCASSSLSWKDRGTCAVFLPRSVPSWR